MLEEVVNCGTVVAEIAVFALLFLQIVSKTNN